MRLGIGERLLKQHNGRQGSRWAVEIPQGTSRETTCVPKNVIRIAFLLERIGKPIEIERMAELVFRDRGVVRIDGCHVRRRRVVTTALQTRRPAQGRL